jgi:type III pantothenate kinase
MNLIIDIGNTVTKLAVFEGNKLLQKSVKEVLNLELLNQYFKDFPEIDAGIICSVADDSREISDYLASILNFFIELDHHTPLPIKNLYLSRETLGYDRIADAVGAHTIFPDYNVLIIDAGTAITIDLITNKGEFLGGNISPGVNLRARALHKFTSKLPLVQFNREPELLAKTTEDAIISGILNGAVFEIDGYISELKKDYKNLKIILTGGDIKHFDKKLKNSIFVDSNLNLTGLNKILDYNNVK